MRRIGLWTLTGLLLTAACGDDDNKGKSAPQKCKDLINTFCDRVTSCAVEGDILEEDYSAGELKTDCRETIGAELDCDDADDVGDNYAECLSDLKKFSCQVSNDALLDDDAFAAPPASCDDAVLFIVE